jgi:hypothetical protein
MLEKGYVSKTEHDHDKALYESLKARIDADILRAQEKVDWAKRMNDKGYLSKEQLNEEILKHYDALKARIEGAAVSDAFLEHYDKLKRRYEAESKGASQPAKPAASAKEAADDSRPKL